jgi:hypothetical protein
VCVLDGVLSSIILSADVVPSGATSTSTHGGVPVVFSLVFTQSALSNSSLYVNKFIGAYTNVPLLSNIVALLAREKVMMSLNVLFTNGMAYSD